MSHSRPWPRPPSPEKDGEAVQEVRDELVSQLRAGHRNSAVVMTWIVDGRQLSKHIAQKCRPVRGQPNGTREAAKTYNQGSPSGILTTRYSGCSVADGNRHSTSDSTGRPAGPSYRAGTAPPAATAAPGTRGFGYIMTVKGNQPQLLNAVFTGRL